MTGEAIPAILGPMTFLPIVEHELRVRARQKITHRFRLGSALIAMLLVTFMLFMGAAFSSPQTMGQPIFHTLAWLAFGYCLFEGARNTADCLSEEKRAGTLGLLFLTDLKGYDVVLGKFMATSLNSFYGLLAIFPPLAIPILVGGVTGGEFWRLVLTLANTLFFSLCTGMFVSSISREERAAWGTTVAILLLITLGPIAFRFLPFPAMASFATVSPGVGFFSVFDAAHSLAPDVYSDSLLVLHLLSWSFLIGASLLLPRVWQEGTAQEKGSLIERMVERLLPARDPAQGIGGRHRLRYVNPVAWLACSQQRSTHLLWLLVAAGGVAGVLSWVPGMTARAAGQSNLTGPIGATLVVIAVALHFTIALCLATEACHFFPDARSSGALELLLCTPLPVFEIVEGHRLALKRMFGPPVMTLAILEVIVVAGHVWIAKSLDPVEAIIIPVLVAVCILILMMDLYAAGEYGMWMGLVSKKSTQAVTKTALYVLLLPALSVVCCFWPVLAVVKNLILINYARDQMRRRFRVLVTERFTAPEKESEWLLPFSKKGKTDLPPVLYR